MSRPSEPRDFWTIDQWDIPIARFAWHVGKGLAEYRPFGVEDKETAKELFLPSKEMCEAWKARVQTLIVKWHGLPLSAPIQQILSIHFPRQLDRVDVAKDPPPLKDVEYMYYLHPSLLTDKQVAKILFWEHLTACSWIRQISLASSRSRFAHCSSDQDAIEAWSYKTALETAADFFKSDTLTSIGPTLATARASVSPELLGELETKFHALPCLGIIRYESFPTSNMFRAGSSLASAHTLILKSHELALSAPVDDTLAPLLPNPCVEDVLKARPLPTTEKIDSIVKGSIGPVSALYRTASSMLIARNETEGEETKGNSFKYSWLDISRELPNRYLAVKDPNENEVETRISKFFSSWMDRFKQAIRYVIENSGVASIGLDQPKPAIVSAARDLFKSINFRKEMMLKDVFEGYTRIGMIGALAMACATEEFKQDVKSFCEVDTHSLPSAAKTAEQDINVADPAQRREDLFDRLETKRSVLVQTITEKVTAHLTGRIETLKAQAAEVFAKEAKDALSRITRINQIIEDHNEKIRQYHTQRDRYVSMQAAHVALLCRVNLLMIGNAADAWMKYYHSCFIPEKWNKHVASEKPESTTTPSPYHQFKVMRLDPDRVVLDQLLINRMPHMAYLARSNEGQCLDAHFRTCINKIEMCLMLTKEATSSQDLRFFTARFSDLALFSLGQLQKNCIAVTELGNQICSSIIKRGQTNPN